MLDVKVRNWGAEDEPLRKTHPQVWRFLFKKTWNEIDPREVGVLTVAVRPTGLSVTLKMPTEAQSCTILVRHTTHIWDALERALLYREGDWKELKSGPGAQKIREERKKLRETRKTTK